MGMQRASPIIRDRHNCWRRARTSRVSVLIDTAAYFQAFKAAALRARHSILILGWDVNSRSPLEFDDQAMAGVPNELGPFLNHLAASHDELSIRILDWDSPLFLAWEREWLPQARFDWFTHPRLRFALDSAHPLGASQHQKVVVIDDSIAFVGGADLTCGRLDDQDHLADDPRRPKPGGGCWQPYHDVQIAVDGVAARLLGDLARERWLLATGEQLPPCAGPCDAWPDSLAADFTDVDVAIARTLPKWKRRATVREVEALFIDSIARAEHCVYIENQYFTSAAVARAMLARLGRSDCPEFVLVLPREPTGWLEQQAMGVHQRQLLARLRAADSGGKLRVYAPLTECGAGISVHDKLMVVDDRFLRVGSANLNNRSMGFDSECDVALEVASGSRDAATITGLVHRLLAEHLGVAPAEVAAEVRARGSLGEAIEALRGPGRSLIPFPESSPTAESIFARPDLVDPHQPVAAERVADDLSSGAAERRTLRNTCIGFGGVVAVLLALAALWHWGPLATLTNPQHLDELGQELIGGWGGLAAVLAVYLIGSVTMFPVIVLIAATGLLFGPVTGLLVAVTGSLLGAVAGYGVGAAIGRETLHRLSGRRIDRISRQLARRGIMAVTIIRLLPLLPFTLVNFAAGASHIRLRDFVVGTFIGMAPGISAMTLFSSQLGQVLRAPGVVNIGLLVGLLLVAAGAAFWAWRRFGDAGRERTTAGA
jgi:phospholipase D1/2